VSDGIHTIICTDTDVAVPHWSLAVAVMTGCEASDLPVESHVTIDSPVPRNPCVDDDHVTVTVSPFGSEAIEDRATFAPKSFLAMS
jgi:hypothetical protein